MKKHKKTKKIKLITVKIFENYFEAHILKSRLESENIRSYIQDENMITINPLYNITLGGIKLKIESGDYEKTQTILKEIYDSPVTDENDEILICPKCNSDKIYSDFKSTKSAKGIISILISFLLLIYPIYYKTMRKCKECDFEFKI
ncbi:hypothetical protein FHR24_002664 [Wenyingzhuangia heitensis]|uniref:Signal transducing protein n=1 Tax=Wenyingzhuangia heitensis TaxID=1487859 RepID=A0ABX0UG70_9FLAO|nr:DUF2007 domain-containing protein [Wenyingzhuangia heitensis]NIJ46186.1 hypothetical protein [Wenyingzhuangia heitensis]